MIAEDRAPKRKYLSAASFELGFFFIKPAKTYVGIDISSHAMNSMTRSVEYATKTIPIVDNKISE